MPITNMTEAFATIGIDFLPAELDARGERIADFIHDLMNTSEEVFADVCAPNCGPVMNEDGTYRSPTDAERHAIRIDLAAEQIRFDLRTPSIDSLVQQLRSRAKILNELIDDLEANAAAYAEEFGTPAAV